MGLKENLPDMGCKLKATSKMQQEKPFIFAVTSLT